MSLVKGLHHVTAFASNPQANFDFYAGVLGLRLVKKTVNFDAPEIYHLYYGNEVGSPGTIITFFPYPGIPAGRKGNGQLTVTSFSIPEGSVSYWLQRLAKFQVKFEPPKKRFDDEQVIYFEDPEGIGLELVANKNDNRSGYDNHIIPHEYAIKGFYGITLSEASIDHTEDLLTNILDHELIKGTDNRYRYAVKGSQKDFVDILINPDYFSGREGSGTVHHVAFAAENDEAQLAIRKKINDNGHYVTPVLDREYFHSIYFREPGGVLFEIATTPPGFTVDEPKENLGSTLKLPAWIEPNRATIEKNLMPLNVDLKRFSDS